MKVCRLTSYGIRRPGLFNFSVNVYILITLSLLSIFASDVQADMAFVANLDGNWDLFSMNENGKGVVRLTQTPYDEKDPSWSPDRRHICYATSDGQINIVDAATRETDRIVREDENLPKMSPSFSPNGKEIAFVQFKRGGRDDTDLMVYHISTKTSSRVLDQTAMQSWPAWSPDGRILAYANIHCGGGCGRVIQELWMAEPKGGWARQLLMTNALCQQPVWSPHGRQIAFSSDKGGDFDIWVLSLDGWTLKRVTEDAGLDVSPAWSPEGNSLAFVSTRSGIMEIWIKDLRSGDVRRLRPFGERDVECKDVAW